MPAPTQSLQPIPLALRGLSARAMCAAARSALPSVPRAHPARCGPARLSGRRAGPPELSTSRGNPVTVTPWTAERIAELEALWMTELATAEIGRRMGLTRNAVIGKAHRVALPPRDVVELRSIGVDFISLVERIPQTGCRYIAARESTLHEEMFCGKPCLVVQRASKPERSAYCAAHHALTHLSPAPRPAEARHAD